MHMMEGLKELREGQILPTIILEYIIKLLFNEKSHDYIAVVLFPNCEMITCK